MIFADINAFFEKIKNERKVPKWYSIESYLDNVEYRARVDQEILECKYGLIGFTINSSGGYIKDIINLHNICRTNQSNLYFSYVTGGAQSCAAVASFMFDHTVLVKNSTFMFHEVQTGDLKYHFIEKYDYYEILEKGNMNQIYSTTSLLFDIAKGARTIRASEYMDEIKKASNIHMIGV